MNAPRRRPLSLNNLRAFEAVARLASFSAAAEELYLTQSAMRPEIKNLEDELGAALVRVTGEAIAVEAARLRQVYPISLPDPYCLATAGFLDAALASFDQRVARAARAEGIARVSRRRS